VDKYIDTLIRETPIPRLQILKNPIESHAENSRIFKCALNDDLKILLCAPAGGILKKGIAYPFLTPLIPRMVFKIVRKRKMKIRMSC
jgi:hypothetical protein